MVSKNAYEQTVTSIATLGKTELTRKIKHFRGRFKLDFSEEYLNKQTADALRHILLAALMNANSHN